MSDMTHTPGTWVVTTGTIGDTAGHLFVREGPSEYGAYGPYVCHVHPQNSPVDGGALTPDGVCAANARLIAAAPDLLAELRETADWLDERAAILRQLADDAAGIPTRYPSQKTALACALRDEAARHTGRAAVIRQTILKATQGA